MKKSPRIQKLVNSIFIKAIPLAVVLAILNYFVVYFPQLSAEEEWVARSTAAKKWGDTDSLKFKEAVQLKEKFLLIDVSDDQQVYCDSGRLVESGLTYDSKTPLQSPCINGPDLKKITMLFKWLSDPVNMPKYKLIVCDLLVDGLDVTKENEALLGYILKIQSNTQYRDKIIFANMYDRDKKEFVRSPFSNNIDDKNKGAVDVDEAGNLFIDYRLSYEGGKIKTLPLLMHERIDNVSYKSRWFDLSRYEDTVNKKSVRARNIFLPDMTISNEDIDKLAVPGNFDGNTAVDTGINRLALWQSLITFNNANYFYLEEALKTGNSKNIFIGSFNHRNEDMHNTMYGKMDGATILLNIYLNLVNGKNRISWGYVFFMLLMFYGIALLLLHPPHLKYNGKNFAWRFTVNFLAHYLQYVVLLLIIFGSNIWFNTITNALAMGILLSVADKYFGGRKENKKRKRKNETDMGLPR